MYWYCIELIALGIDAKNITFALEEDAETIAMEWSLDQLKVQEMMTYMVELGLFENDANGRVTCLKLAKRLDDTNSKNPELRRAMVEFNNSQSVQNAPTPTNSDNVLPEEIRLEENKPEEKILKKEISAIALPEINQADIAFDLFWEAGMRKINKQKAKKAFNKKLKENKPELKISSPDQPELFFAHHLVSDIKERLKNKQFGFDSTHPTSYLNGDGWTDEKRDDSKAASGEKDEFSTANASLERLMDTDW